MRLLTLVTVAGLALAAGCNVVPIHNVTDSQVMAGSGKSLTATQVRTAIITAGAALGWKIVEAGPGKLEGTLRLREHSAVVDIPYSATRYSITYKGGENLRSADGSIHKNYNGWIQNLDRGIRASISTL